MIERIAYLWPEVALFVGVCITIVIGLSPNLAIRRHAATVCGVSLIVAALLGFASPDAPQWVLFPGFVAFLKPMIALIGLMLLLVMTGTVDAEEEALIAQGKAYDPMRSTRAEFYAFFLFSLMGAMLVTMASDLVWLFLALELTSLPTYVMVVLSGKHGHGFDKSQEAGVKYFFLGALAAAMFLYGFALLYGATGTVRFAEMAAYFARHGLGPIALAGMVLAILGMSFKIAAVPMHFYTADVYQGASSSMAAFLAFVPKAAGFVALLIVLSTLGWSWPDAGAGEAGHQAVHGLPPLIDSLLWVMAIATMTVGNVLAVLQSNIKRMLAYSSIAHSGYMLTGIVVGPGHNGFVSNGIAAVLFYLLLYGVMNTGAFAVLACLHRSRDGQDLEVEQLVDLRGLCKTHPVLGWSMALCMLSLLGFPPIIGFFGKLPLMTAALGSGRVVLVVVLAINSAIAAFYYLRVVATVALEEPLGDEDAACVETAIPARKLAAALCAVGVVVLSFAGNGFMRASDKAAAYKGISSEHSQSEEASTLLPAAVDQQVSRRFDDGI